MKESKILADMTKAEQDAEKVRRLEERLAGAERQLLEYSRAMQVMVAAGIVRQEKVDQALEITRGLTG